ncbi:MAG: aminotransferase class I/II-fold pyridoxal phosphate-dependent enzyme, partial [Actinocatenispora sp.]
MSTDVFSKVSSYGYHDLRHQLESEGKLPYFRVMQSPPTPVALLDGEPRVNLGSSNYLGLSGDPRICAAAQQATEQYGTSLNGSRFMNGTTPLHLDLESEVAHWLGEEDALVFPSGYSTNLGVISALVGPDDAALCDAGDHASILDGASLAAGRMLPFRHNRLDRLESLLGSTQRVGGTLVIVDSVYSMQGDLSDIVGIAGLCRRHSARLLVDEAHACGVL